MKIACIAIGIPGSGKTTLLRPFCEEQGLVRISRDDIRVEFFGDPFDRRDQARVHEEAYARMATAFQAGMNVLLDSTFAQKEKRERAIQEAREAGAERVVGIVFPTELALAKERNRDREHMVPEDVIDRLHAQLADSPPALTEGFDALYTSEELPLLAADVSALSAPPTPPSH